MCYQLNIGNAIKPTFRLHLKPIAFSLKDTKELKVLEWRDGSVHHIPEFSIVATGPSYVVISYKDTEGNANPLHPPPCTR